MMSIGFKAFPSATQPCYFPTCNGWSATPPTALLSTRMLVFPSDSHAWDINKSDSPPCNVIYHDMISRNTHKVLIWPRCAPVPRVEVPHPAKIAKSLPNHLRRNVFLATKSFQPYLCSPCRWNLYHAGLRDGRGISCTREIIWEVKEQFPPDRLWWQSQVSIQDQPRRWWGQSWSAPPWQQ